MPLPLLLPLLHKQERPRARKNVQQQDKSGYLSCLPEEAYEDAVVTHARDGGGGQAQRTQTNNQELWLQYCPSEKFS